MTSTMDERGRVLIPKDLRDALDLTPGSPVVVEEAGDGVLVRRALPQDEALERLAGAIHADNRRRPPDPAAVDEARRIWEPNP